MRRNLPKITTLQCFDAVAQHLSMTYAAQSLHMTQSAISKQIKALEQQLGRNLFYRQDGRLSLTPVGEQYASEVKVLLSRLADITDMVSVDGHVSGSFDLKVVTEPTIAMHWLVPRLREFGASYPDVKVHLHTDFLSVERNVRKCDAAILFGHGNWPGCEAEFLRYDNLVAVATRKVLGRRPAAKDLDGIIGLPFLHHNHPISSTGSWLKAAGKTDKQISQIEGGQFEHFSLLLEAVKHGLGVSVLPKYLVEKDIVEGNLALACELEHQIDGAYYLVYNSDRRDEYAISNFRKWLLTHKEPKIRFNQRPVELSS
ncbi:LysR substrate-binding domain-containing protein [Parahaliea maris]|nr:LysR substrate-binding domain-containing protein [Parahaliea maris]